jgi:peroxiredoxin
VVVAVAVRLAFAPAELRSETGALEFTPAQPAVGAQLSVTYRATPRFDGIDRLRLRARLRRPGDLQYGRGIPVQEVATLTREDGGTFRGSLALPEDVVYGVFAVEDEVGVIVDSRGQVGWDLLTWVDGRPSYDALVQQTYEALGRDLDKALRAITRATELYPDEPGAWYERSAVESAALGDAAYDSLRAFHVEKLRELDLALRDRSVDPEVMGNIYFYAITWEEADVADRWRARVLSEALGSAVGTQLRAAPVLVGRDDDPAAALRVLDEVWVDAGAGRARLAEDAFNFARSAGNVAGVSRWAQRLWLLEPWMRLEIAKDMFLVPGVPATAFEWLAGEADALSRPDDARRALFLSGQAQEAVDARTRREVFGLMGRVLLAAGERESGLALLDSAVAEGWDTALLSELADARLEAGDVHGALALMARLAADPGYSGPDVSARALPLVGQADWDQLVVAARRRMIDVTLGEASLRGLPPGVSLRAPDGATRDLRTLVTGHVTVVAFFVPGCRACIRDLQNLHEFAGDQAEDVRLVLVTRTTPSEHDLALLRAEDLDLPVWIDYRGAVAEALDSWGTAEYFVIDRRGVVRFAYTEVTDIPRQVLALSREERPVA